jgi:small subunit ribosomal protein S7
MRRPIKNKKTPAIDPKYQSVLVSKLVNYVMERGKKDTARKVVYEAFETLKKEGDPVALFQTALENVQPSLEVRSRRVGGANYQVPIPVSGERRQTLAMRWIREVCRKRKGKAMAEKLADELIDASNRVGAAMKKREEVHRMADANKAFAHFA